MSTTAIAVTLFLSSLGIDMHVSQGYDAAHYIPMLRYTGIRTVRDGYGNLNGLISIHRQTGATFDIITGCDIPGTLSAARTLADAGALLAVEGPNEPNNWPIMFNGQRGGGNGSWAAVAGCQAALYNGVKDNAVLKKFPVFHVSEGGAETDNAGMQFLTVPMAAGTVVSVPAGMNFADYANAHNYVSGHVGHLLSNMAWLAADPVLNGPWDGLYGEYGRTWKKGYTGYSNVQLEALPRVTTETGWDSVSDGNETEQAQVLTNTYLAQFARGWRYTFVYEMVDAEGSTGAQGLYRADGSAKPAADYIHNLTTILADAGTETSPRALDYSVVGKSNTVHDLLLQKSDGGFELVIWSELVSGSNKVTVLLGQTFDTIRVYNVAAGTRAMQALSHASSVSLTLSGYSTFVIEVPSGKLP